MPAHALQPQRDWLVLDACAAPGNKTTHLAGSCSLLLSHPLCTLLLNIAPLVSLRPAALALYTLQLEPPVAIMNLKYWVRLG